MISLASTAEDYIWKVRGDHSVSGVFAVTKTDAARLGALTERCKSTRLFKSLCASAPYYVHRALPLLLRVEDYAREAATSDTPQAVQGAAFAGLMQIAGKDSNRWTPEEKVVLSWMVHRVKDDRVLATVESLREFYKWYADPYAYKVPAGYGFESYAPPPFTGIAGLLVNRPEPPTLHRKELLSWFRDYILGTIAVSGFGPLVDYTGNAPDGIGFPTYGQALAFRSLLDYNFPASINAVTETDRARAYVLPAAVSRPGRQ